MKTLITPQKIKKEWYIFDASQYSLGRLATRVARVLLAKNKAIYTPQWDLGDYVVVTNASKFVLTGKKGEQKEYLHHTGFPGGLKSEKVSSLRLRKPEEVIRHAVWGMLPKGKLGHKIIKNLFIFANENQKIKNVRLIEGV